MPGILSNLFHKFPHYDFTFNKVSSKYDPKNSSYFNSLLVAGSVHLVWLILVLLAMGLYLPTRIYVRRKKIPRNIGESSLVRKLIKISAAFMFLCLIVEILLLGLIIWKFNTSKKKTPIVEKPAPPPTNKPFIRFMGQLRKFIDEKDTFSYYQRFTGRRQIDPYARDEIDNNLFLRYYKKPIPVMHRKFVKKWHDDVVNKMKNLTMEPSEPYFLQNLKSVGPYKVRAYCRTAIYCLIWIIAIICILRLLKFAACNCPRHFGKFGVGALVLLALMSFWLTAEAVSVGDACQDPARLRREYLSTRNLEDPPGKTHEGCLKWVKQHFDILEQALVDYENMYMDTTKELVEGSPYFWKKRPPQDLSRLIEPHEEFVAMDLYTRRYFEHRREITDGNFWTGTDHDEIKDLYKKCPLIKPRIVITSDAPKGLCYMDLALICLTIQILALMCASILLIIVLFMYIKTRNCVLKPKAACGSKTCSQPITGACDCKGDDYYDSSSKVSNKSSQAKGCQGDVPPQRSAKSTPRTPVIDKSKCSLDETKQCKCSSVSGASVFKKLSVKKTSKSPASTRASTKPTSCVTASSSPPKKSTRSSECSPSTSSSSYSSSYTTDSSSSSSSSLPSVTCRPSTLKQRIIMKKKVKEKVKEKLPKTCSILKPCKGDEKCSEYKDCPGSNKSSVQQVTCSKRSSCSGAIECPSEPCPGIMYDKQKESRPKQKSCSFNKPCSTTDCPDLKPCTGSDPNFKHDKCPREVPCPGFDEICEKNSRNSQLYSTHALSVYTPSKTSASRPAASPVPSLHVTPSARTPLNLRRSWRNKHRTGFAPAPLRPHPFRIPFLQPKLLWNSKKSGEQKRAKKDKKRTRTIYLKSPQNMMPNESVFIKIEKDGEVLSPDRYIEACRLALQAPPPLAVAAPALTLPAIVTRLSFVALRRKRPSTCYHLPV